MEPDLQNTLLEKAASFGSLINAESIVSSSWIYLTIFFLIVSWLLMRFVKIPFQMLWRRGYDESRRLESVLNLTTCIIFATVFFHLVRNIFLHSPLLLLIVNVLFFSVVVFSTFNLIANFASGISLLFSPELVRGKRIELGSITGVVRHRALLRTIIQSDSGETVWVPNNIVTQNIVKFSEPMNSFPVQLHFSISKEGFEKLSHTLREITVTSPFRKEGTAIEITPVPDQQKLDLLFYTWSPSSVREAKSHIVKAFEKSLENT